MAAPKLLPYIKELFKITQFIKIKSYIHERVEYTKKKKGEENWLFYVELCCGEVRHATRHCYLYGFPSPIWLLSLSRRGRWEALAVCEFLPSLPKMTLESMIWHLEHDKVVSDARSLSLLPRMIFKLIGSTFFVDWNIFVVRKMCLLLLLCLLGV